MSINLQSFIESQALNKLTKLKECYENKSLKCKASIRYYDESKSIRKSSMVLFFYSSKKPFEKAIWISHFDGKLHVEDLGVAANDYQRHESWEWIDVN